MDRKNGFARRPMGVCKQFRWVIYDIVPFFQKVELYLNKGASDCVGFRRKTSLYVGSRRIFCRFFSYFFVFFRYFVIFLVGFWFFSFQCFVFAVLVSRTSGFWLHVWFWSLVWFCFGPGSSGTHPLRRLALSMKAAGAHPSFSWTFRFLCWLTCSLKRVDRWILCVNWLILQIVRIFFRHLHVGRELVAQKTEWTCRVVRKPGRLTHWSGDRSSWRRKGSRRMALHPLRQALFLLNMQKKGVAIPCKTLKNI